MAKIRISVARVAEGKINGRPINTASTHSNIARDWVLANGRGFFSLMSGSPEQAVRTYQNHHGHRAVDHQARALGPECGHQALHHAHQ